MNNSSIAKYFDLAKNASKFSDFPKYHIGAILVYKNRVISVGWNVRKENPLQKKYNEYRGFNVDTAKNCLHAEMMCIVKAKKLDVDWSKVSIFVYREFKNGKLALAKPCPACMQAIKDIGIKNIYYTGDESHIYESLKREIN